MGSDHLIVIHADSFNSNVMQSKESIGNSNELNAKNVVSFVSKEDLRQRASTIRFNYYDSLPYAFVKYNLSLSVSNLSTTFHEIPSTTHTLLQWKFSKLEDNK